MKYTTVEVEFYQSPMRYTFLIDKEMAKRIGKDGLALAKVSTSYGYEVVQLKALHPTPQFNSQFELNWVVAPIKDYPQDKLDALRERVKNVCIDDGG